MNMLYLLICCICEEWREVDDLESDHKQGLRVEVCDKRRCHIGLFVCLFVCLSLTKSPRLF